MRSSRGHIAGSLTRYYFSLVGVVAQMKQFLTYIPFSPRIYIQSPWVTAAKGHRCLVTVHSEGSVPNDSSGTTSESAGGVEVIVGEGRSVRGRTRPRTGPATRPGTANRPETQHVDDRRRQVPEADRLGDDPLRGRPRGNDHQRDVELGLIQARPVPEDAGMLAEALAMVRGDDHPGPFEDAATLELVDTAGRAARPGPRCNCRRRRDPKRSPAARAALSIVRQFSDQVAIREWSRGLAPKR